MSDQDEVISLHTKTRQQYRNFRSKSEFHRACEDPDSSIEHLSYLLSNDPAKAGKKGLTSGLLPIMLVSQNEKLLDRVERKELEDFICELVLQYPLGVAELDSEGMVPFAAPIAQWIENPRVHCHISHDYSEMPPEEAADRDIQAEKDQTSDFASRSVYRNSDYEAVLTNIDEVNEVVEEPTELFAFTNVLRNGIIEGMDEIISEGVALRNVLSDGISEGINALTGEGTNARKKRASYKASLTQASIAPNVERSFRILSLIASCLEDLDILSSMVENIASISGLIPTILLVEDSQLRDQLLSYTIVRRTILCENTIGNWLVSMLQSSSHAVKNKAVGYLQLVSTLTTNDLIGDRDQQVFNLDEDKLETVFEEQREHLFDAISDLENLIPSMLSLKKKALCRVVRLPLIKEILANRIMLPHVIAPMVVDLITLFALIFAFRLQTVEVSTSANFYWERAFALVLVCTSYFIVREVVKGASLIAISTNIFWSHLLQFWTMVDIFSVLAALVCATLLQNERFINYNHMFYYLNACSFTTGLLWLKVIGVFKVFNQKLSSYIMAIEQITADIIWFLVIMMIASFAYAQMSYTAYVAYRFTLRPGDTFIWDTGETDISGNTDFGDKETLPCHLEKYFFGLSRNQNMCYAREHYIMSYNLILGDFDRDNFQTVFQTLLFIIYSFFMIVLILNILIAIASTSYEESIARAEILFGMSRMTLIAGELALERLFLRKKRQDTNRQDKLHLQVLQFFQLIPSAYYALFFTTALLIAIQIWAISSWDGGIVLDLQHAREGGLNPDILTFTVLVLDAVLVVFFVIFVGNYVRKGMDQTGNREQKSHRTKKKKSNEKANLDMQWKRDEPLRGETEMQKMKLQLEEITNQLATITTLLSGYDTVTGKPADLQRETKKERVDIATSKPVDFQPETEKQYNGYKNK